MVEHKLVYFLAGAACGLTSFPLFLWIALKVLYG